MQDTLLEMRGIRKTFPGVTALDRVDLTVRRGEIHALVGENGAGKSTLMKVLSGVHPHGSFDGEIVFDGQPCAFRGIADSEAAGIIIIHQELALVPLLSITENIFLGNEPVRPGNLGGIIDWARAHRLTGELLAKVGLKASPETLVTHLGVGQQQLVEIAKALSRQVRLLILDEPTASLNESDSQALLELLLGFKAQGISSILISHKLNEISRVADAVTVLRDGSTVDSIACVRDGRREAPDEAHIIRSMVGRALTDRYPRRVPRIGEVVFELRDWVVHHPVHAERAVVRGVNLQARRGEIVGIAGLMGAGRTELAMSVFGRSYGQRISGEVRLRGRAVDVSTVQRAIAHGLAYVTEDRKGLGLLLDDSILHNVSLVNLAGVARRGVIDDGREHAVAGDFRRRLGIRCRDVLHKVVNLSGGNQQKVVLAKWLFSQPEVLILDEPTRGVDVGAKYEIYTIMAELAAQGACIVMISSEMPELLGMCDRIHVMNEGRFVAEFDAAQATQERIMKSIIQSGPQAREAAHVQ